MQKSINEYNSGGGNLISDEQEGLIGISTQTSFDWFFSIAMELEAEMET